MNISSLAPILCLVAVVIFALIVFLASAIKIVPEYQRLVLFRLGRCLGERGPGYFMDEHGGAAVFEKVKPLLEPAALSFVNVEGPISTTGTRASWKEYTFRGRPALADGLASAGIDVISLANNHSMDYGSKALGETLVTLSVVDLVGNGRLDMGDSFTLIASPLFDPASDYILTLLFEPSATSMAQATFSG